MNSRFVRVTTAIASFSIAVFFILYFSGLWRWVIASPLLVFVTWPSLKIGLFSSKSDIDKLTEADQFEEPINPYLLLIELVPFSRFILYAVTAYLSYTGFPFYIVPLIAIVVTVVKFFNPIRYSIVASAKRENGIVGILKSYPYFYFQDFIIVSVVYGLGLLIREVL